MPAEAGCAPPRERLHGGAGALGREEEIAQVTVDVTLPAVDGHHLVPFPHRFQHGIFRVELLPLLVVVGRLHVGAGPDETGIGSQFPQQQLQESGLARAIRAEEADPVPPHDPDGKIANHESWASTIRRSQLVDVHDFIGKGFGDVVGFVDKAARGGGRLQFEPGGPQPLTPGGALGAHSHQGAHPPLVPGPSGLDPTPEPRLLLFQPPVEFFPPQGLVGQPLLLPAQELAVAAFPGGEPPPVELHDPAGQPLQEFPVVGDGHHRPRIFRQEAFEPGDRPDIEVVGRLVQEQELRLGHQHPGQQHPAAPPAREGVHDRVGGEFQAGEDRFDPLLEPPAVPFFQFLVQPPQAVKQGRVRALRNLDSRMVVLGCQAPQIPQPFGDRVENGAVVHQRRVLVQQGRPHSRLPVDRPGIRHYGSGENRKQCRLPRPVAPEDADPLPLLDLKRGIVQQGQGAVGH